MQLDAFSVLGAPERFAPQFNSIPLLTRKETVKALNPQPLPDQDFAAM